MALAFAAMVWAAWRRDGILRRVFQQKWLCFFGVYSYSIYLFHLPIRAVIRTRFLAIGSSGRCPLPLFPGSCCSTFWPQWQ